MKTRHRIAQRLYLAVSRFSRGMTLGVRALLIREGRVLLVRHSYVPGWYLPGGGVEAGESAIEALRREVREEAGATLRGPATLFGFYRHPAPPRRDHVAVYLCRDWERDAGWAPNLEIREAELFPLLDLPPDAAPSTRARVDELLSGKDKAIDW